MEFRLTPEQQAFQESVRRFAERHLAADAVARAHRDAFPWDVARLMAESGLFGIMLAEEDGGQGGTLMDAVIAAEEIAKVCPRSADVLQAGNFGAFRTFAEYATPAQKERWFAPLLAGEAICAVGMTEPEAGSALTDLRSTCTPDGNGYRLNGGKVFTSNSDDASVFLIYCRFGPGTEGIGSVILERGMEGFTLGEARRYMNGEIWRPLHFDNVFIPPGHVLLKEGGFRRQIAGFNVERVGNSARSRAVDGSGSPTGLFNRDMFGTPGFVQGLTGPVTPPGSGCECLADFNGSGAVTVQDIFDFLAAYFAALPSADVNTSGSVTVQDIFDYLSLYFAGCN